MAKSSSLGGGVVAEVGWGIGVPVERVPVPEPLHAVEAREPDSKASGFTKSLSATCSWNFVKSQRGLSTEGDAKPSLQAVQGVGVAPGDVVGEVDGRVERLGSKSPSRTAASQGLPLAMPT